MTYAIEMIDICKYFPRVKANDHVTLQVVQGEIMGILGENGSGKTTLMNVLFGLYEPNSGVIKINGKEVEMNSPRTAIDLGIEMIHQHFMLVENLTVADNIILGEEPNKFGVLDRKKISQQIAQLLDQVGFQLDPNAIIEDLSVGSQQRVEILKALYRKAKILILDEPTAVLTPQEANELFSTMRRLKKQGVTIIFISHKLREIMAICDRATVLRHGEVVGVVNTSETTTHELARMMVGREVLFRVDKKAITPGETVIEVKNLSAFDDRGLLALDDISLNIKAGEIVGIAGVQGNGQSELVETLTGLRKVENGEIVIGGVDYTDSTPREILKVGVAHIPEDRQRRGLVLNFSLKENVILGLHYYPEYSNYTVFANERVEEFTKLGIKTFEIKVADLDTPISTMSGGNQQKIILARELLGRNPKLIIAAQPTRGLDVGVIEYVHKILIQMCGQGLAILLISTELDEIRSLADRAFVLFKGKFMAEVDPKTISDEDISLLMAGESLEGKN